MSKEIKVLYVEDSSMARHVVREYLEEFVDTLVVVDDGSSGLEAFNNGVFDIVVTDIKMPNMDGFTLIENIKQKDPNMRIIIVSAFKGSDEIAKMKALGVDAFLKKPLELEELKEAILTISNKNG